MDWLHHCTLLHKTSWKTIISQHSLLEFLRSGKLDVFKGNSDVAACAVDFDACIWGDCHKDFLGSGSDFTPISSNVLSEWMHGFCVFFRKKPVIGSYSPVDILLILKEMKHWKTHIWVCHYNLYRTCFLCGFLPLKTFILLCSSYSWIPAVCVTLLTFFVALYSVFMSSSNNCICCVQGLKLECFKILLVSVTKPLDEGCIRETLQSDWRNVVTHDTVT